VLGDNYPGSQWYQRAFDLMQKHAATWQNPVPPSSLPMPGAPVDGPMEMAPGVGTGQVPTPAGEGQTVPQPPTD
jgi:outer membrane protein assembly factor BamD